MPDLILHEYAESGNCYKIRLTAAHVGAVLERREYDIRAGATRTAAFRETINAAGLIPVLQVGDRFLPESGAACWYLADGSALIPDDRFERAEMLRWMFFEQYSHEPAVAVLRFWTRGGLDRLSDFERQQAAAKRIAGDAALQLMDKHLNGRSFFAGQALSLADIALYAYTHVADEAGFVMGDYSHVAAWLARVAAAPGHVPMDA